MLPQLKSLFFIVTSIVYALIPVRGQNADYRNESLTRKGQSWYMAILHLDRGRYHFKNVLKLTSYLLLLASKTSFTELDAKHSRAPSHLFALLCHFGLQ
jgi:hypothetical protein